MALYEYQAYTKNGKKVRATIDASSLIQARELVSRQGLYVIAIETAKTTAQMSLFQRIFSRAISFSDTILFTKQLTILLKSGVPLLQSCDLLIEQFQGSMRSLIVNIRDSLKEGVSFADAISKYPQVFENLYVQLVRAGEASGNLETILERLTDYLERRKEIKSKVISALRQPLIQLGVALAASVALLTFVVPQMVGGLAAQGKEIPLPTAIVLSISNFITGHYFILLFVIIFFVVGFVSLKSTSRGKKILDMVKLKVPIISHITKISAVSQFSYTLGMLLEGGVHLAEALDIVTKIIDNSVLADAIKKAREDIIKEGKIAQYLEKTNMFPLIAIYLIRTGENTGQLDAMLFTVGKNYEKELMDKIDALTGLINPIMLIVMAVIVGLIVLAVVLPMTEMGNI